MAAAGALLGEPLDKWASATLLSRSSRRVCVSLHRSSTYGHRQTDRHADTDTDTDTDADTDADTGTDTVTVTDTDTDTDRPSVFGHDPTITSTFLRPVTV
jgi:hypothetical protein